MNNFLKVASFSCFFATSSLNTLIATDEQRDPDQTTRLLIHPSNNHYISDPNQTKEILMKELKIKALLSELDKFNKEFKNNEKRLEEEKGRLEEGKMELEYFSSDFNLLRMENELKSESDYLRKKLEKIKNRIGDV